MPFDIFISYRHSDGGRVRPIADALRALGLQVWIDEREIDDFSSITGAILRALSETKCLLAYYSANYPRSRACQWELTSAFLAAQRQGDPRQRILVINPEAGADHIHPIELRDALFLGAPASGDPSAVSNTAAAVARQAGTVNGTLGQITPLVPPQWYGLRGVSASRFVGRLGDLWGIHSGLHAVDSAVITQAAGPAVVQVSGLGGTGKSVLAEEYALRFGAAFPGGIFWLRASESEGKESPVTADEREAERTRQILDIAAALDVPMQEAVPEGIDGRLARRLAARGEAFLWIVDDFPAGQSLATLRQWIAPHPLGRTLVTTRSREYQSIGSSIALGQLDAGAALQLLTMHRQPAGATDEAAARGLIEDLGCMALAVEVAGSALAAYTGLRSFAEFREALATPDRDELELARSLTGTLPTGHETSVASTLSRSIRQLDESDLDLLRLASVLAVAPIPPPMIVSVFQLHDALDAAAARQKTAKAIHRATQLGLIDKGHDADGVLSVHALVSRTVRFTDRDGERRVGLAATAVRTLAHALSESDTPTRERHQSLLPHAWELASHDGSPEGADLMSAIGYSTYAAGAYGFAARAIQHALDSSTRRFGESDERTLRLLRDRGVALMEGGALPEARKVQERYLSLTSQVFGDDHIETLGAVRNLALTLYCQDELAAARQLQERDVESTRRILGDEAEQTLSAMHNLAVTLTSLGDLAGSQQIDERILAVRRRVLGEDHPDTLKSMANLAVTLQARGQLAEARALNEEGLARRRRLLGEDHPDTLTSIRNLGVTLERMGDLPGAKRFCAQASAACRRVLGDEHPFTLMTLDDEARILDADGHAAEACTLHEQVLEARRRTLGEQHVATLQSAHNLAFALRHLQRYADAQSVLEQALAARGRDAGQEDAETLKTMQQLAGIFSERGNYTQSAILYQQILAARRRLQGVDHPDTIATLDNTAWALRRQGDLRAAAAMYRDLAATRERLLGAEDSSTTLAQWRLFYAVRDLPDDEEARRVLDCHLRWLVERDPASLTSDQRTIRDCLRGERWRLGRRRLAKLALGWLPHRT